ncbi:electron transport complex subunit RsxG [Aidingimonas lacisalsi]|uniref:electron transport complex subunit RsxG n=1 Tax=Aidingimonas lacisalsi TaxID=2604086 RepID=UPI0011D22C4C|nr:electron transport complex subunit RsxG [Aidingimonas lacisalsi]
MSERRDLIRATVRAALGLGMFAMVTVGVVAATRALTEERIADNRLAGRHRLLGEVLPSHLRDMPIRSILDNTLQLPANDALGHPDTFQAWRVTHDERGTVILPVIAGNGYNGDIELLVGITDAGTVSGVRVTRHQETPGLGDKIERRKSDWIKSFNGRSLGDPDDDGWEVASNGGEFDAFTGATITPRAVVQAVHRSLVYAENHRDRWQETKQDTPQ